MLDIPYRIWYNDITIINMILDNIDRKETAMDDNLKIAGYCRISVDEELDKDNTSIENQKALITDLRYEDFFKCSA